MMLKVNSNTEDHTLYTCRTVPIGHIRRVPCNLLGMSEPKQYCGHRYLPYSVVGAIKYHDKHGKTPHMPLGINNVVSVIIYHTW